MIIMIMVMIMINIIMIMNLMERTISHGPSLLQKKLAAEHLAARCKLVKLNLST